MCFELSFPNGFLKQKNNKKIKNQFRDYFYLAPIAHLFLIGTQRNEKKGGGRLNLEDTSLISFVIR